MPEPVNLAVERAMKAQDSGLLSPRDALCEVIRQIDAGELVLKNIIITGIETTDSGKQLFEFRAQTTYEESIALLSLSLKQGIEDWVS